MAGRYTTPEYRTPKGDSPHILAALKYQSGPGLLLAPWLRRSKESSVTTVVRPSAGVHRLDQTEKQREKRSPERGCRARQVGSIQNKNANGIPDGEYRHLLPAS